MKSYKATETQAYNDIETANNGRKQQLKFISYMQVIGIILVVLGHSMHEYPERHGYGTLLYQLIYSFHMPLFMFVSGFLMIYSARGRDSLTGWTGFQIKSQAVAVTVYNSLGCNIFSACRHVVNGRRLCRDVGTIIPQVIYLSRQPCNTVFLVFTSTFCALGHELYYLSVISVFPCKGTVFLYFYDHCRYSSLYKGDRFLSFFLFVNCLM